MATLNVMDFGAVGGSTGADTAGIKAAIAAAQPGDTIYFPRAAYSVNEMLNFAGKDSIAVVGSGSPSGRSPNGIYYAGPGPAAISFVGASQMVVRDLFLWTGIAEGDSSSGPPCALILGRDRDANGYPRSRGQHFFQNVWISGYANTAILYNVASEENTFLGCHFNLVGGLAKSTVIFTQNDELHLATPSFALPSGTCLSNWLMGCTFLRSGGPEIADASLFKVYALYSTGDLYLRDGFMGTNCGAAFHVELPPLVGEEEPNAKVIVFENFRCENTASQKYGVRITGVPGYRIEGLTMKRLHFSNMLYPNAHTLWCDDGITLNGAVLEGNYGVESTPDNSIIRFGTPSSLWAATNLLNNDDPTLNPVTVRGAASYLVAGKTAVRGQYSHTFSSVAAGATQYHDVALSGAAPGDIVTVSCDYAPLPPGVSLVGQAGLNAIRFEIHNHSSSSFSGTMTLWAEARRP